MSRTLWFIVTLIVISGGGFFAYWLGNRRPVMQPKIFVSAPGAPRNFDLAPAVTTACPRMAFVTDSKQSDYNIVLVWDEGSWSAYTERTDSAELPSETNADYEAVLRRVCGAIARDARLWGADRAFRSESDLQFDREDNNRPSDGERYELRDLRIGTDMRTGLIDRRSGRVWIWTQYRDQKGNYTGSGFLEEDETPKPDNQ